MFQVIFYENQNGESPVKQWLQMLDSRGGKKTELTQFDSKIRIIKELGTRAGADTVDFIADGIWELRPGRNRVLFAVWKGKILLLHQFSKKTNKCPPREIAKAKNELSDWIERNGK